MFVAAAFAAVFAYPNLSYLGLSPNSYLPITLRMYHVKVPIQWIYSVSLPHISLCQLPAGRLSASQVRTYRQKSTPPQSSFCIYLVLSTSPISFENGFQQADIPKRLVYFAQTFILLHCFHLPVAMALIF